MSGMELKSAVKLDRGCNFSWASNITVETSKLKAFLVIQLLSKYQIIKNKEADTT